MANPTMTLIASNTVGSGGVASVTFSSIPATYRDLQILMSCKSASSSEAYILMTLNGSSSSFTGIQIEGNGSAVSSATNTVGRVGVYSGSNFTGFTNNLIYIPNYAGSTNKSISADSVTENNNAASSSYQDMFATLWSNTSAITSISFAFSGGTNFAQYSTAYLYGIKNS